jgi:hypothetical protein
MDDADRKMWGTFILVGGVVISFALWRGALHYYGADKPGAGGASPVAYEAMLEERVRQANERAESGEEYPPNSPRAAYFTGTFTADQQQQILAALRPYRGCAVSIRPSQGSEGSTVSTNASKAASQHFAGLFWKVGWDAGVVETSEENRSRGSLGLTIVVNPDPPADASCSPLRGAQALLDVLKRMGIRAYKRTSTRVDARQFELQVGVEAR